MMRDKHNLGPESVIETAKALAVSKTAYLTAAYTRHADGPWRLVVAKLAATTEEATERTEQYPEHGFASRIIQDFSLQRFLDEVGGNGCFISDPFPPVKKTEASTQWIEELVPSHVTGRFPLRSFRVSLASTGSISDTKLAAFGMPVHKSAIDHLRQFVGLARPQSWSACNDALLFIEIADERGRIAVTDGHAAIAEAREELCMAGHINDNTGIVAYESDKIPLD
jgi:hypothetical protein